MKNEIKFKAYLKEEKQMAFVDSLQFDIAGNLKYVSVVTDERGVRRIDAEDVELLQYIGQKDKNKKDIYDGNILMEESPDYDHDHEFKCFDKKGKLICNPVYKTYEAVSLGFSCDTRYGWLHGDHTFNRDRDPLKIAGNIYENPELLK